METELKPCPFCGGEAKILENGFGFFDVSCKKLSCRGYTKFLHYTNKEKAISKWNTRTPKERGDEE